MKIFRVLSEADCRAVIDMRTAIDLQAKAFTTLAQGQSVQGLRSFAASEDPPGVAIFNPCFLREGQDMESRSSPISTTMKGAASHA